MKQSSATVALSVLNVAPRWAFICLMENIQHTQREGSKGWGGGILPLWSGVYKCASIRKSLSDGITAAVGRLFPHQQRLFSKCNSSHTERCRLPPQERQTRLSSGFYQPQVLKTSSHCFKRIKTNMMNWMFREKTKTDDSKPMILQSSLIRSWHGNTAAEWEILHHLCHNSTGFSSSHSEEAATDD